MHGEQGLGAGVFGGLGAGGEGAQFGGGQPRGLVHPQLDQAFGLRAEGRKRGEDGEGGGGEGGGG
ncbi:hypothetical protein GCM10018980_64920 [Streptomyces capoamus]|uniref:Uncharacterized protein n=1 Tax=Streptomyces capoamus TaxID=68183 RepID=A0A919KEV2_9ACTN|nr:hypothetical protein GCM10018980_64920 [Streptomyces capoamus]